MMARFILKPAKTNRIMNARNWWLLMSSYAHFFRNHNLLLNAQNRFGTAYCRFMPYLGHLLMKLLKLLV